MRTETHIGRYEVLGLLGTGGMAEVFLGRIVGPAGFQRPVVIKRMLPHLARQQSFVNMFLDEARIVARIRHANVVQVQELCQDGNDLYIVMEYLEGESLDGILRRLTTHKRLLEFGLVAHILAEVSAGLHAAHELTDENGVPQNLVHRDMSPANIFVTYDGHVKILDFGIATAVDRLSSTHAGQVKGKYPYMSPEQCRGHPLDRRSDLFSLGIVLYELSTCRRLFRRVNEMETAAAICSGELIKPSTFIPSYPPALETIALKALQVDPNKRYRTAAEMKRDFQALALEIGDPTVAEERLANVMRRLFEDRIEEKRAMLRKVASGEVVTTVTAADADENVVVPPVVADASPSAPMLPAGEVVPLSLGTVEPAPSGRPLLYGAIAALAIVLAAVVILVVRTPGLTDRPNEQPEEARPTPATVRSPDAGAALAATATTAPASAEVEIEVVSDPDGAKVSVLGEVRGTTPVALKLPKGAEPVELHIERPGYKPLVERVVPDRDQRVRLVLVPRERPRPTEAEPAGAKPKPAKKPYRRFD